jgi:hypothetical protein
VNGLGLTGYLRLVSVYGHVWFSCQASYFGKSSVWFGFFLANGCVRSGMGPNKFSSKQFGTTVHNRLVSW